MGTEMRGKVGGTQDTFVTLLWMYIPTSSGETCLTNSKTESKQDGLNIKIPKSKWVMAGGHVPGL